MDANSLHLLIAYFLVALAGYAVQAFSAPLLRFVATAVKLLVRVPARALNGLSVWVQTRLVLRRLKPVDWTRSKIYRKGKWEFENGTLYLRVDTPEGIEMISLETCDPHATPIFHMQAQPSLEKESVMAGSTGVAAPLPKSCLLFYGDNMVLGVGTRVNLGRGVSGILTARHVLTRLKSAHEPCVGNGTFKFPLGNLPILVDSKQLDIAMIALPEQVVSAFGVTAAKVASPVVGRVIHVPFCDGARQLYTRGSITLARGVFLKHNASTVRSASGAPLLQDGKLVGIHHTGRPGQYNIATAVSFLNRSLKESDSNENALRDGEVAEPDFEIEVRIQAATHTLKTAGMYYDAFEFERRKKSAGQVLWADLPEDESFEDYDPFEAPATGKATRRSVLKESAIKRVTQAVKETMEPLNCMGRVSGESPTTSTSTGQSATRAAAPASTSSSSVRPTSGATAVQIGRIDVPLGSKTSFQPFVAGDGLKRPQPPSSAALPGTQVITGSAPNRSPTTSSKPSKPSPPTTPKLAVRAGCVPARLRRALLATGIVCGKKRAFITKEEVASCRAAGVAEELCAEMHRYAPYAPSKRLRKRSSRSKQTRPQVSPGRATPRPTSASKKTSA
nr:peptidase [Barnaviridae sp.]